MTEREPSSYVRGRRGANYKIGALHFRRKCLIIFNLRHVLLHSLKHVAILQKNWHHLLGNVVVLYWATTRYNVNFTREEDVLGERGSGGGTKCSAVLSFPSQYILCGGG